jgi:hypothetical protein
MATNMDKSLYQAPEGIATLEEDPIEIEIVDPEEVTISAGGMEIILEPGSDEVGDFNSNLAEMLDDGILADISSELIELVDADINSRKDWAETFVKGLEVLGLQYEERTEPWNGACGVYSTILTEAAIRFQSESIMETFPAAGPVKTEIIGKVDKKKEDSNLGIIGNGLTHGTGIETNAIYDWKMLYEHILKIGSINYAGNNMLSWG